jgi:ParB-like chromosome segregation protein Spo0J
VRGFVFCVNGRDFGRRVAELPLITLSGLSETQKRTLRIAENKIALNAGWDLEILQLELDELASIDVDIDPTLTGFSTGEIRCDPDVSC